MKSGRRTKMRMRKKTKTKIENEAPASLGAWLELDQHKASINELQIQDLFKENPYRFSQFSLQAGGILFDYSKQKVTRDTLELLCRLAESTHLKKHIEALFLGEVVNTSEQRPALHTALRDPTSTALIVDGYDIKLEIRKVLEHLENFAERVRQGQYRGSTGSKITDILSLGIGGSDLGPSMVCEALREYKTTDLRFHFVSNIDGKTLAPLLKDLLPETTLCIIHSKTFTTLETMENAKRVKEWLQLKLGADNALQHLVGVTANVKAAETFGITKSNIFEFWDFVGGRYSIWSAVGLTIILFLGIKQFKAFLEGAYEIDKHFYTTSFKENMPVLMGLIGIWNINFLEYKTHAVIVYDDGLRRFPNYLQQLEMESNGKQAKRIGGLVSYPTAPIVWGGVGCDGQHAYMQLLHQGTQIVPVDFIVGIEGHPEFAEHQQLLVASCLSQSKALMEGNHTTVEAKICQGSRPSSTLMYAKLTPKLLGALIALYEHKVFVQGIIWSINSFDQWGVELGKQLVGKILPCLKNKSDVDLTLDSSTKGLIDFYQSNRSIKNERDG